MFNTPEIIKAIETCGMSRNRVNALMEAFGIEVYANIDQHERDQIKRIWDAIADGNSCWMTAWLCAYQYHNQIGEFASPLPAYRVHYDDAV